MLEARDRVGGRVCSRRLENGAVIELGAEFILPGNTMVIEMAAELRAGGRREGDALRRREPRGGAPVDPRGRLERAVEADGPRSSGPGGPVASRRRAAGAARDRARRPRGDPRPGRDLLGAARRTRSPPPISPGSPTSATSRPRASRPGTRACAEALASELGPALRLSEPVGGSPGGRDGVRGRDGAGRERRGRCLHGRGPGAASPPRSRFEPALPARRPAALARIPYGQAAKLLVPLPRRGRAERGDLASRSATGPGPRPARAGGRWRWSAASAARRRRSGALGVAEGPERWLESLARLRPELELEPAGAVLSRWDDDPWAGAAYSVSPPPQLVGPLQRPLGPLAFAGEHLGGRYHGLMEGALRSGARRPPDASAEGAGLRQPCASSASAGRGMTCNRQRGRRERSRGRREKLHSIPLSLPRARPRWQVTT